MRLGVNLDHVCTLRQARYKGEEWAPFSEPDLLEAARLAEKAGAYQITVHLREDRRHLQDKDLKDLRRIVRTRLNLELALSEDVIALALKVRPDRITLVPERRQEVTTEGGLDVRKHLARVEDAIQRFRRKGIRTSCFIAPDPVQVFASACAGADAVELHTGAYARNPGRKELGRLKEAARLAKIACMAVYAGHGLTEDNAGPVARIPQVEELNIGHSIVSRAVLRGLGASVRAMRMAMACLLLLPLISGCFLSKGEGIAWKPWTDDVLQKAAREKRLVLLSLETSTPADPGCRDAEALKLARKGYLAVKADPRERPDLAGPCQVRAWPMVLVLDDQGNKLAERTGPLSAEAWTGLLSVPSGTSGPPTRLDADEVEQALEKVRGGDAEAAKRLRARLASGEADPAEALRAFSRAWAMWGDPGMIVAARDLRAKAAGGSAREILARIAFSDATGERLEVPDPALPTRGLGEALDAGRAYLALYRSTGDRAWLGRAEDALRLIRERFGKGEGGYLTAEGGPLPPCVRAEENAGLARFSNLLFFYTGKRECRDVAERAAKAAGVELKDPFHVTVIGTKGDAEVAALYRMALSRSPADSRVEWWDRKDGPLPNADVDFPVLSRASAYVCKGRSAGGPLFTAEDLRAEIDRSGR